MSAQVNLAALFKPSESEMWKEDLLWQPVSCCCFSFLPLQAELTSQVFSIFPGYRSYNSKEA